MLRHAIVGAGATVLGMHRPAFSLPTTQIVGVTDTNAALAEQRAEELGCPVFPDYQTMIQATRPDVVVVMTPHPFHAEIAIAALEAGCHVLCEKPMAVHVGEADHAAVYRDLHAAILDGTPLASDGFQGRLSLELANAITLSSRRGVAVDLPLDRAAYLALLNELRTPTR